MDKQGFRNLLLAAGLNEEQIGTAMAVTARFDAYIHTPGRNPTAETAWAFSNLLIAEGENTEYNYSDLMRYCRFIQNNEMFIAFLELVDGGEVAHNLYQRAGEQFGFETRDQIFAGIGVAPYGTPSPAKPDYLQPVISRLEAAVGKDACQEFLSACLRDLPDEYFIPEREKFHQAGDIDTYLAQKKEGFLATLEACQREGRMFFAQEVTPAVIDFVRSDPEMGGGCRQGNIIFETKIPYMAKQYLAETDPTLKRYYACHCPWARDAVKNGDVKLAEVFCACSAGFHKKSWEVIFEQPLKVEVLESILKGNERCRFAIILPADALNAH